MRRIHRKANSWQLTVCNSVPITSARCTPLPLTRRPRHRQHRPLAVRPPPTTVHSHWLIATIMVPRKPVCRAVTGNVVISQLVANIQQVEAQEPQTKQGITTSLPRPCSRSYAQSVGALLLYGNLSPTNLKLSLHRSCLFFSKHFSYISIFMKQWCQKRSILHNHSELELIFPFRNCRSENNLSGKSRTSNLQTCILSCNSLPENKFNGNFHLLQPFHYQHFTILFCFLILH